MTFQQLMLELIDLRFSPQDLRPAQVKRALNAAETAVWNAADWSFKRVPVADLAVTAGVAAEPADFGKAMAVYDPDGAPLCYLAADEFERRYRVGTVPVGEGSHFTVIDRQILVGPANTATYKLAYRRRVSHLNAAQAVVAGVMALDSDTPLWDVEHHYLLIPWAAVLLGNLEGQPGNEVVAERDRLLAAMVEELVGGTERAHAGAVWGGR